MMIGNVKIKNRMMMAPMDTGFGNNAWGGFTPEGVEYFARRAEGGFGLLFSGGTSADCKVDNSGCRIITWNEAITDGEHQAFDLGYVKVEAVEAGYNRWHDVSECVGYVLTLSDGVSVYVTGDTSKTRQMPELAVKKIDYAFFCCDGVFNMDLDEAAECAALVQAKHSIPYHVLAQDGVYFDRARAEQFKADNRLIIDEGEEIIVNAVNIFTLTRLK